MTKFAVLIVLAASIAWGQTAQPVPVMQDKTTVLKFCAGGSPPKNDPDCIPAEKAIQVPSPQVAPLKCGKYQHVYHWPGQCGPADCDATSCYAVCYPVPPDRCVDDMHAVTEREWQELINTLDEGLHAQLDYDKATQAQIDVLVREIDRLQARLKALEKGRK